MITKDTLPAGKRDTAYAQTVAAVSSVAPPTWSLSSGTLPSGLGPKSANGQISGIPTINGSSLFTVRVTDRRQATQAFTLAVTL